MPHRPARDSGQTTPVIAAVLAFAGLLLVPTALLVEAAVDRARARSAADAAALAGALADPVVAEADAREIAEANGAELVAFGVDGAEITVTVVVDTRRATATAERELVFRPAPVP